MPGSGMSQSPQSDRAVRARSLAGALTLCTFGGLGCFVWAGATSQLGGTTKWSYRQQTHPNLVRRVVAAPPAETAPPSVSEPPAHSTRGQWLECLIQHELQSRANRKHAEVWVLRRGHINFFRRFLTLRGFHAWSSKAELKCRERGMDSDMRCVECTRLLHGGFYGHMGVAVPAHPPQRAVLGCLGLSKVLNVTSDPEDDQTGGSWDANPTRQFSFCNTMRVKYDDA
ncbi:unnamed protein product [Symbiodinium sp. CCMP2456]|nr:unnamed protein product [Symbiodinium sp. CCMP2456]